MSDQQDKWICGKRVHLDPPCKCNLLYSKVHQRKLSRGIAYYVVCDNGHETYLSPAVLEDNSHILGK